MDCDRCHERPARYHVKRVVNGQTLEEADLCERCAAERGELPPAAAAPAPEAPMSIQQLLAMFLAGLGGAKAPAGTTGASVSSAPPAGRCPHCGHLFADFARTGLLGCPACYDAFAEQLEGPIRRLHGSILHDGKVPHRGGAAVRRRRAMDELRRELQRAVAREEFERAAELRDRLRALEAVPGGAPAQT